MDFHHKTKDWFYEAVRMNMNADSGLKDKIIHGTESPDMKKFLANLDRQIKGAQAVGLQRGRVYKEETIKGFVYDLTDLFLKTLERKARQMYESDVARLAREAEAQQVKDMESTLAGKPSGIFEEAGVLIDDETRQDEVI